jgi:hypothetical protein
MARAPGPGPRPAPNDMPMVQQEPFPLYRSALPNGLRVWVQPRPSSESVVALLMLRAGSHDETAATNGVSHYVEHMVFTGTERCSRVPASDSASWAKMPRWRAWPPAAPRVLPQALSPRERGLDPGRQRDAHPGDGPRAAVPGRLKGRHSSRETGDRAAWHFPSIPRLHHGRSTGGASHVSSASVRSKELAFAGAPLLSGPSLTAPAVVGILALVTEPGTWLGSALSR